MGKFKEIVYGVTGVGVGLGVNEILKGVEIVNPGTIQNIVEVFKSLPPATVIASWAAVRVFILVAGAISGDRPPKGPIATLIYNFKYSDHHGDQDNSFEQFP